jgi:DNA polymerase-3 subunit epsilon
MLSGAPTAPHIWPRLVPRLEPGVLVAHNLSFDYRFLRAELQREQIEWSRPEEQQLCTVRLSRRLLSELPSRSLPDLVRHFDFPVGASHRAEADTRACWHLLVLLMERLLGSDEASLLTELGNEWLSLSEAARIAGLSRQATLRRLREQGHEPRVTRRGDQHLYRRAWAEALRASS